MRTTGCTSNTTTGRARRCAFATPLLIGILLSALPGMHEPACCAADEVVTKSELRTALKTFRKASRSKRKSERVQAVKTLAAIEHEDVAKALVKFFKKEDDDGVRTAVLEALMTMTAPSPSLLTDLAEMLEKEAETERKRIAKGDPGFRIDTRTGRVDDQSPEGLARLMRMEMRGKMLARLVTTLARNDWQPKRSPPDLTPLLQDAHDELVVAVLERIGAWKDWGALPAVLALFEMYPTAATWETGAVVDLGGTNASAQAKWMVVFGHPKKQTARPTVHAALLEAVKKLTGETVTQPEDLKRFLERKDVDKRIAKASKRR